MAKPEKLFAITGKSIRDNGRVSYAFMVKRSIPYREFAELSGTFGWLRLRRKGDNEVNPFKLVRGEPGAVGDDGVKKWEIFVFRSGRGQIMTGSVEETPEKEIEEGLKGLLEDMPNCVLLMSRDLFDRFEKACQTADINLDFHHYEGELATS